MKTTCFEIKHLYPVIFLYLILQLCLFAPRLNSDGAYYYEYVRSWVVQNDLNFDDEREFYTWKWVPVFREFLPGDWEDTGYPPNIFSFGPAFFWLPFFLITHLGIKLVNGFGAEISTSGYGLAYRFLPMIVSMLSGLFTLLLCDWLGKLAGFSRQIRSVSLFLYLGASHLPAFLFVTPAFSHPFSVLFTTWFVVLWYLSGTETGREWNAFHYALFGVIGGCAVMARWQNLFCMLLPMIDAANQFMKNRKLSHLWLPLIRWISFGFALIATISPQLLVTRILYGVWVTDPQGDGGMHWFQPRFRIILFDGIKGLFTVNPILLPAAVALPLLWKRNKRLCWGMILLVLSQTYINAVRRDWAGVGFGMRRFLNLTPAFVLGLMVLFTLLQLDRKKIVRVLTWCSGGLLIIWNVLLMAQYYLSALGAPWIQMTFQEMVRNQFTRSPDLLKQLTGTSLMIRGIHGSMKHLLLSVISILLLGLTALIAPAVSRILRNMFARLPNRLLVCSLTITMMITGWIGYTALSASKFQIVNLIPGKKFGNLRTLNLSPESGYHGYNSGVLLSPGKACQIVESHFEYDLNRFLDHGSVRYTTQPEPGNHQWFTASFPSSISIQELTVISHVESARDVLQGESIGEIVLYTVNGSAIRLPVIFGEHTGKGTFNHGYRAIYPMNSRRTITGITLRLFNTQSDWIIQGIAFD